MTEADWDRCTDPAATLRWLQAAGRLTDRKARLFACACCRRIWPLLTDERSRRAVDVAEEHADARVSGEHFAVARAEAETARQEAHHVQWVAEADAAFKMTPAYCLVYAREWASIAACKALARDAAEAITCQPRVIKAAANHACAGDGNTEPYYRDALLTAEVLEAEQHALLLRDLFGPLPFRPATVELSWRTAEVVALAQTIYDEHAFERMAQLADALEQAGRDNQDITGHCREQGQVHVRGCWVIDLLLGKE